VCPEARTLQCAGARARPGRACLTRPPQPALPPAASATQTGCTAPAHRHGGCMEGGHSNRLHSTGARAWGVHGGWPFKQVAQHLRTGMGGAWRVANQTGCTAPAHRHGGCMEGGHSNRLHSTGAQAWGVHGGWPLKQVAQHRRTSMGGGCGVGWKGFGESRLPTMLGSREGKEGVRWAKEC